MRVRATVADAVDHRLPAAFMSYATADDRNNGGALSRLRQALSEEVHVQTGEPFAIFQDREDIQWGQSWKARIDDALDSVTLLIPVMSPSFFRSDYCRKEVKRFAEREQVLGRNELILPIYYVTASELEEAGRRAGDEVATLLASRQRADWRDLRFNSFDSEVARVALAELAARLRDSFWQPADKLASRESSVHRPEIPPMVKNRRDPSSLASRRHVSNRVPGRPEPQKGSDELTAVPLDSREFPHVEYHNVSGQVSFAQVPVSPVEEPGKSSTGELSAEDPTQGSRNISSAVMAMVAAPLLVWLTTWLFSRSNPILIFSGVVSAVFSIVFIYGFFESLSRVPRDKSGRRLPRGPGK